MLELKYLQQRMHRLSLAATEGESAVALEASPARRHGSWTLAAVVALTVIRLGWLWVQPQTDSPTWGPRRALHPNPQKP